MYFARALAARLLEDDGVELLCNRAAGFGAGLVNAITARMRHAQRRAYLRPLHEPLFSVFEPPLIRSNAVFMYTPLFREGLHY